MTLATVCCWVHMSAAAAMPKNKSDNCRRTGSVAIMVLKYDLSKPSSFCCLRLQRSSKDPRPNRDVLKYPSHCLHRTAPNAVRRLVDRHVYASVCLHITIELGPVQTGRAASWSGNVPLSILFINIFRSVFVVSAGLGVRLEFILTMNAEATAEKRPA